MKKQVLFLSLLNFVFLFLSCQSLNLGQRNPAQSNQLPPSGIQRHYIIAVHGIGGDASTFGAMSTVLVSHLKKLRPETEFIFKTFTYPTGDSDLTAFDFGYKYLSSFLRQNIPNPTSSDRISFVAHSQGGLVSSIWYAGAVLGVDADGDSESEAAAEIKKDQVYTQITEQIITLGTPFWGSKLATYLNDNERVQIQKLPGLNYLLNLGDKELREMSFSSNTVYSFRQTAIALTEHPRFWSLRQPEFIQIAGVYPRDEKKLFYSENLINDNEYYKTSVRIVDFLNKYFQDIGFSSEKINSSEPDRPESDVAVIVPSSRSEFLYSKQDVQCDTPYLAFETFRRASVFRNPKYYLTESIHSPVISNRSVGIASIPEFCLQPEKCAHPSYSILLRSLARCEQYQCQSQEYKNIITQLEDTRRANNIDSDFINRQDDLQGFSLEVNIKVPKQYEFPVQYYTSRGSGEGSQDNVQWILRQKDIFKKIFKPRWDLISKEQSDLFEIKAARSNELYSSLVQWKTITFRKSSAQHLRVHLTGLVKPKLLQLSESQAQAFNQLKNQGFEFPFELSLPRYIDMRPKPHLIRAQIKPGFSTFIDLDYNNAIDCSK